MQYQNSKTRFSKALTLVEMVIAMAIMAIVFAAILPQFRAIQNSWDSKQAAAETLQNSRVLMEHLYRNLSKAVKITAVSDSSETNGYIEFEDNDENIFRYDIAASNYVEFGPVGDLYELAGPVSQLQFTCYDGSNFDTATTNVNFIRFVKVEAILTNSSPMGQDITLETSTYLRTNVSCLVGWWKLDETSGKDAADSSGNGNDGRLKNMAGDEWTTGIVGGALAFDGIDDYIDCGDDDSLNIRNEITMSAWVNLSSRPAKDHWFDIIMKGDLTYAMYVQGADTALTTLAAEFDLDTGYKDIWKKTSIDIPPGEWVHVAVTFDNTDCKLYVNGVLDHTENIPGTIDDNAGEDLILVKGNGDYLEGSLDDVRIYSRAMIFEEVASLAEILRYQEFTEAKLDSDGTLLTISTPGGVSEGSLLIAAVATNGDTTSSLAPPLGEGWTQINLNDYGSEVTLGAWWKLADASESPGHQFTWSGDQQAYGWMMRFTGHDPNDPIDIWAADGEADTNPTCPSVTTTVGDCLILRLGAFDGDSIIVDDPGLSGHTAITMDSGSSDGSGTVGWWKLDDGSGLTAADSSGNGNDGTLTNMAGNEWTSGQVGGALEFDGNNDYIDCGNDGILDITDEITLSAWINMSARPAKNDWVDITYKAGAYSLYLTGQKDTETVLSAEFFLDTGTIDTWTDADIILPLNSWVHVAVTFDGTDAKGYVNGELDFTINQAGTIDTTTNPFTIGDTDGEYYEGFVDDVRIYDLALSAEEISQSAMAFTEKKEPDGGTSLTIDTPADTSEDDLLIAAVATESNTSGSLAPPGGWTEIDIDQRSNKVTLGVWWKLAGASEPGSHEFAWSGNEEAYGWIMRFRGHDTTSPIDDTAVDGGKSETPESPAVTTTVANATILRIGGFKDDDITVDAPGLSGHTAITMDYSRSGGKCSGGAGYVIQAATGSSGTSNFSLTGSKEYRVVTIAIAPDPAGGGGGDGVSGGAGYIKQLAIGGSGTSDFALTASEESRTLTIAIAPEASGIEAIRP